VLRQVADFVVRLDNLSHCLVWSKQVDNADFTGADVSVDVIEFPRLQLSFHTTGSGRELWSTDHVGLFISSLRSPLVTELSRGLPTGLLLENLYGELFMLVPSSMPVRTTIVSEPMTTELIFDRNNLKWLTDIGIGHYLYPLHLSKTVLFTPTLASALYLLLLRFMNRQYKAVFDLVDTCITDSSLSTDEAAIFSQLQFLDDKHPNAHACRLKISLTTIDTPLHALCPWTAKAELLGYLQSQHLVDASCRLSPAEERVCFSLAGVRLWPAGASQISTSKAEALFQK
jgi:hypothetical protein